MQVLISGAGAGLAQALIPALRAKGISCIAFKHRQWDINDRRQSEKIITATKADILINTAAFTRVDAAESAKDRALAVNAAAPQKLAELTQAHGVKFIHLSSNYVLAGTKSGLYTEKERACPLNYYGSTKLAGEKLVLSANPQAVIIRTSSLFNFTGSNFVTAILTALNAKKVLNLQAQHYTQPTAVTTLAAFIISLITTTPDFKGLINYSGLEILSWYEFGSLIAGYYQQLNPGAAAAVINPVADYPTVAVRPAYALLDNSLRQQLLPQLPEADLNYLSKNTVKSWLQTQKQAAALPVLNYRQSLSKIGL